MPKKINPEEPVKSTAEAPDNNYIVYKYTNKINGKVYIGQTKQGLKKRAGKNGINYKGHVFGRAIEKYGWDNFEAQILKKNQTKEMADFWEWFYIIGMNADTYNGYNCTQGGEGTVGFRHSEESKKLMSKNHADMSGKNNPMYGVHLKSKKKGVPMSEEQKLKLRTPVILTNISTGEEIYFTGVTEANKAINSTHVSDACQGIRHKVKGYYCRYATPVEISFYASKQ